jgi:ectoine hydroxylase-related dioxygenase (phytanoyl-CoA dioxygenase family)
VATPPVLPTARLSDEQLEDFERDGFVLVRAVLDPARRAALRAAAEREDAAYRSEPGVGPHHVLNRHDLVACDRAFLELIDHPLALDVAWRTLGWNVQLHHTQLVVTPPAPTGAHPGGYGWHRDNNRMNRELAVDEQPRISVKIAWFLSDVPEPGMGNLCVDPGSHRARRSELPDPDAVPDGAVEVTAQAGDALVFDRRIWHAASTNVSDRTRIVLFYGYSFRWVRPKSAFDPHVVLLLAGDDPIRRQLLGACTTANGAYDPLDDDVPLREWIRQRYGDTAVPP